MKKGTKKNFPIIATPNKDLFVAHEFLKYAKLTNMSIHELRIVIRLIELCNKEITGTLWREYVGKDKPKFEHGLFDVTVTLYAQDVFFGSNLKHKDVIDILDSLSNRSISHESPEEWWKVSFCSNPRYKKNTGVITFAVGNELWDMFTAFAHGVHEFELNTCLSLPSVTSMTFYILISKQSCPISYRIEKLKSLLGIEPDAYKDKKGNDRIDNFEKAILKPIKSTLDNCSPYTFEWEKQRLNPQNPHSKVIGFLIIPIYQPKFRDEWLAKKEALSKIDLKYLETAARNCLLNEFGIPKKDLNYPKNKEKILDATKTIPNFLQWLREDLLPRADEDKGIGWVLNAIENETKDCKEGQRGWALHIDKK